MVIIGRLRVTVETLVLYGIAWYMMMVLRERERERDALKGRTLELEEDCQVY